MKKMFQTFCPKKLLPDGIARLRCFWVEEITESQLTCGALDALWLNCSLASRFFQGTRHSINCKRSLSLQEYRRNKMWTH
jgi:hypothetical protein